VALSVAAFTACALAVFSRPAIPTATIARVNVPRLSKKNNYDQYERVTKKKKKKHHKDDDGDDVSTNLRRDCEDGDYSKRTLKLAYERPMAALFESYENKYETSSVIIVDEMAYAICDSSWSIYKFGLDLQPLGESNVRFGDPDREDTEESDYEALSYFEGTFYVVRESVKHDTKSYHAIIEEIELDPNAKKDGDMYKVGRQCSSEFEFEGDSKGFEGVWAVRDLENELVLLGLCEGNHCSEKYKNDRGNGRLIMMKQSTGDSDDDCIWETVRTINIPPSANFADYSAMAVKDDGYVAITSQEDSQVWIGRLLGKQPDSDLWDVDNLTFDQVGEVFDFPKDNDCATIYCVRFCYLCHALTRNGRDLANNVVLTLFCFVCNRILRVFIGWMMARCWRLQIK